MKGPVSNIAPVEFMNMDGSLSTIVVVHGAVEKSGYIACVVRTSFLEQKLD